MDHFILLKIKATFSMTMRNMFQLVFKQMVYKTDVKVYTLLWNSHFCVLYNHCYIFLFLHRALLVTSTIVHFELNWDFFWNVEVCRLVGSPFGVIWITLLETSICPLYRHHVVFETIKSSFFWYQKCDRFTLHTASKWVQKMPYFYFLGLIIYHYQT